MRRMFLLLLVGAVMAASCSSSDEPATSSTTQVPTATTQSPTTTNPRTSTTAAPTTTIAVIPAINTGSEFVMEPGMSCAEVAALDVPYPVAVAYWIRDGQPAALDIDGDGIPCESVYEPAAIDAFLYPEEWVQTPGLFCRDLYALDAPYGYAVAYWLIEGTPDRMDADRNGIPCETVYPGAEIAAFYPIDGVSLAAYLAPFGDFPAIPLLDDESPYAGPATPQSLDGVRVTEFVTDDLSAAAETALLDRGFVVIPSEYRLMHQVYEEAAYTDTAVYVTTDAAFHYWHLAVSKVLRDSEENVMLPALEELVVSMVEAARAQRDELAGSVLETAADRVTQFLEAAATVLELDVGPIGPLAAEEAALAVAHDKTVASPTLATGECEPPSGFRCVYYSLFKPRGHYTRSADLERYFVAMSLLGNAGLAVFNSSSPQTATVDVESVRRALLLAGLLVDDPDRLAAWELIYEPTAFLVGNADDYTPVELKEAADALGYDINDRATLGGDDAVRAIADKLTGARSVRINVGNTSIRLMGSRFVIDSYVLDQLPVDNSEFFASGLDVAGVFGSSLARELRTTDPNVPDSYPGRLTELTTAISGRTISDWAATVYDAWLYALQAVWADHGAAYPYYMRSAEWHAKDLQTGLGSYAELKHDTILYAKQRTAEGDFPWAPERANWVEPDPVVFARLAAVAGMLHEGMVERGLITDDEEDRLNVLMIMLREFLDRMTNIATDELAGRALDPEDANYLASMGAIMEQLYLMSADEGDLVDQDSNSAIVADIYTGQYGILEVATGRIDHVLVTVPGPSGDFEVAVGGVYSFYEFKGERETDEEWRAMLDAGTAPPRPEWQRVFLAQR